MKDVAEVLLDFKKQNTRVELNMKELSFLTLFDLF